MVAIFGRFLASWFQHLSMIWYLRERKVVMYVEHRQASSMWTSGYLHVGNNKFVELQQFMEWTLAGHAPKCHEGTVTLLVY